MNKKNKTKNCLNNFFYLKHIYEKIHSFKRIFFHFSEQQQSILIFPSIKRKIIMIIRASSELTVFSFYMTKLLIAVTRCIVMSTRMREDLYVIFFCVLIFFYLFYLSWCHEHCDYLN